VLILGGAVTVGVVLFVLVVFVVVVVVVVTALSLVDGRVKLVLACSGTRGRHRGVIRSVNESRGVCILTRSVKGRRLTIERCGHDNHTVQGHLIRFVQHRGTTPTIVATAIATHTRWKPRAVGRAAQPRPLRNKKGDEGSLFIPHELTTRQSRRNQR